MSTQLICQPKNWTFDEPIKQKLLCHHIEEQNVSADVKFADNPCSHNDIFSGVYFKFCNFFEFPSANSILNHCPDLTLLQIQRSKLSRIEAEDLKGFENLIELHIDGCEIEHLPGDLFKYTRKLEIISFYENKIKTVGDGLLTPALKSLKYFDLLLNTGIDYIFSKDTKKGTLKELNLKLAKMSKNLKLCKNFETMEKKIDLLEKNYAQSCSDIATLKAEKVNLKNSCNALEDQLKVSKDETKAIKDEIKNLKDEFTEAIERLKKQVQQNTATNFVVKINDREFKVEKQILISHSKYFAKAIDEHPELESLELTGVPEAIFAEILNFMQTGDLPNENIDLIELFSVSCYLEVEALTSIVTQVLLQKVNPETALKVLIICNKYKDHAQLKAKAFEEFNKNFPLFTIKPELINEPNKLKQLLKAKLEIDKLGPDE